MSDEEEKDLDDVINLTDDKYSAQSLDKMITLIAVLVEKSRVDKQLRLSDKDIQTLTGGNGGGKVSELSDVLVKKSVKAPVAYSVMIDLL